jgi:serine-threonine kinase receptor-associated protein
MLLRPQRPLPISQRTFFHLLKNCSFNILYRRVWDTHSGEETHTLQHNHIVRAVAFPPNSSGTLATGGMEKKLRIFDLERRYETTNGATDSNTIPAEAAFEVGPNIHKGTIKAIVWTLDPNVLVTAADDKVIRWWDLRTQEVVQEYQVQGEIGSCEFSNVVTEPNADVIGDGLPVLTIAAGNAVYFFGGHHARTLLKSVNMGYEVASVALHPSQRKFVTGAKSDTWVKVYDYDSGKEIGTSSSSSSSFAIYQYF